MSTPDEQASGSENTMKLYNLFMAMSAVFVNNIFAGAPSWYLNTLPPPRELFDEIVSSGMMFYDKYGNYVLLTPYGVTYAKVNGPHESVLATTGTYYYITRDGKWITDKLIARKYDTIVAEDEDGEFEYMVWTDDDSRTSFLLADFLNDPFNEVKKYRP
jgi:hypothetical protein